MTSRFIEATPYHMLAAECWGPVASYGANVPLFTFATLVTFATTYTNGLATGTAELAQPKQRVI